MFLDPKRSSSSQETCQVFNTCQVFLVGADRCIGPFSSTRPVIEVTAATLSVSYMTPAGQKSIATDQHVKNPASQDQRSDTQKLHPEENASGYQEQPGH